MSASRSAGRASEPVLTVAHRGASGLAPENTMAAVELAVVNGADMVEVDVRVTRDGVPVLLHDESLARTTDVARVLPDRRPWRVQDLGFEELSRLDAGSWKGASWAGEPVPALTSVLDRLSAGTTGLLLELKPGGCPAGTVEPVLAALRSAPALVEEGRVVVQSFCMESVRLHRDAAPGVPVALLGRPPRRRLRQVAAWASQVNVHHRRVTPSYVAELHRHGLRCLAWTVNDAASVARAVGAGVDGIITDHVELVSRALLPGADAA